MSTLILLILCLSLPTFADGARGALDEGARAFGRGEHEEAAAQFALAASNAPAAGLDPSVAVYNEGLARLKAGQFNEAANQFLTALRTPDLALQQKAYFNRGNALMESSRSAEPGGESAALEQVREAQKMFDQAMQLDVNDPDPKVNFELAMALEQQLLEQKQQQQQQSSGDDKQDQDRQPNEQKDEGEGDDQKEQGKDASKEDAQSKSSGETKKEESDASQGKPGSEEEAENEQGEVTESGAENRKEMSPEEAALLLDAMRKAEEANRLNVRPRSGAPVPVEKDW